MKSNVKQETGKRGKFSNNINTGLLISIIDNKYPYIIMIRLAKEMVISLSWKTSYKFNLFGGKNMHKDDKMTPI